MGHILIGRVAVSKTVDIGTTPIVSVSSFCCLNKIRIVNRCSRRLSIFKTGIKIQSNFCPSLFPMFSQVLFSIYLSGKKYTK